MSGDAPALELRGITKRFGSLVANNAIDFELKRGEIHALLGENGAGKSTLMNVLYGLHQPDEGEILLDGEKVEIHSPRQAMNLGIGMVHQHFMLVPVMTVAENLVLGAEPRNGLLLDYKAAARRTRELSERFGLAVDPDAKVENLGVGAQQRVEILRALFGGAKVLVLDEPTAVLTAQETQDLFRVLRELQAEGTSIVFISHKLNEVLDDLRPRDRAAARGEDRHGRDRGLDGAQPGPPDGRPRRAAAGREARAQGRRAAAARSRASPPSTTASCPPCATSPSRCARARSSAIAGVDANGQSELIEVLTGLRKPTAGTVTRRRQGRDGRRARASVQDAGIGHIAEDRHRRGLVLEFILAENVYLREYRRKGNTPLRAAVAAPDGRARAARCSRTTTCAAATATRCAASLSGGNQQKVVIAREL